MKSQKPRKRWDEDAARTRLIKSSARLLRDLDKFEHPPASVAVPKTAIPLRITAESTSGCRSPAQTCAELGRKWSS